MTTESQIVIDDENESELEKNEINPVTEKAVRFFRAPNALTLPTFTSFFFCDFRIHPFPSSLFSIHKEPEKEPCGED